MTLEAGEDVARLCNKLADLRVEALFRCVFSLQSSAIWVARRSLNSGLTAGHVVGDRGR